MARLVNSHADEVTRLIRLVDERQQIAPLECGYLYYFPDGAHGGLSAWMLRAIAAELDERNRWWDRELQHYFETHPEPPEESFDDI